MAFTGLMKTRIFISLLAAIVSIMYQTETDDDLLMGEKLVVLSKNKSYCFHYLTQFENHQTVICLIKKYSFKDSIFLSVTKDFQELAQNQPCQQ